MTKYRFSYSNNNLILCIPIKETTVVTKKPMTVARDFMKRNSNYNCCVVEMHDVNLGKWRYWGTVVPHYNCS